MKFSCFFFPSHHPSFGKPLSILIQNRVHSSTVHGRAKCLGRCIAHSSSLPPTESILCRWKVLSRYSDPQTRFLEHPGWPAPPLKGPGVGAYLGWTESFGGILFQSTTLEWRTSDELSPSLDFCSTVQCQLSHFLRLEGYDWVICLKSIFIFHFNMERTWH